MIQWVKKHNYSTLALGVLLVGAIAIGTYAWHFRNFPISTDTGQWADFATYLSGTLGVAAVVATLMAFVITLRQQQKLIVSQDQMLEEQREQLVVSKEQLRLTEKGNDVQQAYLNLKDVLPLLLLNFSNRLSEEIHPYESDILGDFMLSSDRASDVFLCEAFYQHPEIMIAFLEENPDCCDELRNYVNRAFGYMGSLLCFLTEQLVVEERLFSFVDAHLSNKTRDEGESYWFYLECFFAFLIGSGADDVVCKASRLLRMRKAVKFSQDERELGFYNLGRLVANVQSGEV